MRSFGFPKLAVLAAIIVVLSGCATKAGNDATERVELDRYLGAWEIVGSGAIRFELSPNEAGGFEYRSEIFVRQSYWDTLEIGSLQSLPVSECDASSCLAGETRVTNPLTQETWPIVFEPAVAADYGIEPDGPGLLFRTAILREGRSMSNLEFWHLPQAGVFRKSVWRLSEDDEATFQHQLEWVRIAGATE